MSDDAILDPKLIVIWEFVRGDLGVEAFEEWAYANADALETLLGEQEAFEVLAADYRSPYAVVAVKDALRQYAARASSLRCLCVTLSDIAVVDMVAGDSAITSIEERRRRGQPWWWLWCGECTRCGQWWLVATEERQNDVFCLSRLDEAAVSRLMEGGQWPPTFDTYESVLRLGFEKGRSVSFGDPEGASSLRWTVTDLAKARPGIRVSELAHLLTLSPEVARRLAERAIRDDGVTIELDRG